MDRHSRQSSLPSSLIPHLYSAPRNSSTRTTLANDRQLAALPLPDLSMLPSQQRFYTDPRQPSYNFPPPQEIWTQPGPSEPTRFPRASNYPPRVAAARPFEQEPFPFRRDVERDLNFSYSQPTPYHSSQTFQPTPQLLIPGPDDLSSFPFDRHDNYSYPPMGSLNISAPSSAHRMSPESPDIQSIYRSDTRSLDFGSNDDESSQKGKRRRQQSLDTDDTSRKSRKTAVACNFCRGRKLRCNGTKPSCYNCTVRKFECEYVPTQRRRGPGKAPKGTRSKRAAAAQAASAASRIDPAPPPPSSSKRRSDRPPIPVPQYELDALGPELRPYTSVLSLNNPGFTFHPQPQYSSNHDPRSMREYYPRARSRETSSDGRSDTEPMYRKMT